MMVVTAAFGYHYRGLSAIRSEMFHTTLLARKINCFPKFDTRYNRDTDEERLARHTVTWATQLGLSSWMNDYFLNATYSPGPLRRTMSILVRQVRVAATKSMLIFFIFTPFYPRGLVISRKTHLI